MKDTTIADADLLGRFAQVFVHLDDLSCFHDEPPPDLLSCGIDPADWNVIRWRPAKLTTPSTALSAIRRVGPLPTLFESFALSYRWLQVDLGLCRLLANHPAPDLQPLADEMYADEVLNNVLLPNGMVRFALAPECYDPICFNVAQMMDGDCPIFRVEHESVLMHDKMGQSSQVFSSFRDLVWTIINLASENATEPTHEREPE